MSSLDPDLEAALDARHILEFHAVTIALPAQTIRLLDGSGFLTIDGETYLGSDPIYGVLGPIDPFETGVDNQAPRLNITLFPPSNTAAALLANPSAQGSVVTIQYGAVDPLTGLVIGEPTTEFVGYVDVPIWRPGVTRSLTYEVASIWERLFAADEGARLNSAFWQTIWPDDLGLDFVTEVQRQLPWGADAPRPWAITDPKTIVQNVANNAWN